MSFQGTLGALRAPYNNKLYTGRAGIVRDLSLAISVSPQATSEREFSRSPRWGARGKRENKDINF